jgi:peptidylprolyl isomerase
VRIAISTKRILYILCALSIACTFMLAGCSSSAATAKEGDTVKVEYTGTLDNGTEFDSSVNESFGHPDPLQFAIGMSQVLPGFEQAVVGLAVGESTTVNISAEDGYGPLEVVYDLAPGLENPVVGQQYQVQTPNGKVIVAIAVNVSNTSVTFLNTHQLAGENLHFKITLVDIVSNE